MPYIPQKTKVSIDIDGKFKATEKVKGKYKSKKFEKGGIIDEYIKQRDMAMLHDLLTSEETKQQIREIWKDRI